MVSLLQRVSPKLSLPLGYAWHLWRIQDTVRSWNKDWTWTSILCLALWLQTFMSETVPNRTLEASYILGMKIDSLLLLVTEEQKRIVQFRLISNLLRSMVKITSGLLTIFLIVARILAIDSPVALHWLAFLLEEVVWESPLYPVDLVLRVSPQLSDQLLILQSYPTTP